MLKTGIPARQTPWMVSPRLAKKLLKTGLKRWMVATLLMGAIAGAAGSCAKSPTVVLTTIDLDSTVVPLPLLLLRATVVSQTDATQRFSQASVSLALGDAGDRPGPYRFPLQMSVSVPAALAGPITLTIEGLDWDTGKVIASGMANAEVIKDQQTRAAVLLTATRSPGGSGGTDGEAGDTLDASGSAAGGDGPDGATDL